MGLAIYGLFLSLFVVLAYLAHQNYILSGEIALSRWLQGLDWSPFHGVMLGLTFLGKTVPAAVIVVISVVWLLSIRRRREANLIAVLTGSAFLAGWLLKLLIARPRPADAADLTGFPSGHTIFVMTFYGFLFYLTPKLLQARMSVMILRAGLALVILLTGVSRVYLEEHWPVDVLGSLVLGGLFLALAVVWYEGYNKRRGI